MKDQYVLFTKEETYLVEYLIGELVLTKSISEAKVFNDYDIALNIKTLILKDCKVECSINTFID